MLIFIIKHVAKLNIFYVASRNLYKLLLTKILESALYNVLVFRNRDIDTVFPIKK